MSIFNRDIDWVILNNEIIVFTSLEKIEIGDWYWSWYGVKSHKCESKDQEYKVNKTLGFASFKVIASSLNKNGLNSILKDDYNKIQEYRNKWPNLTKPKLEWDNYRP